jgi:MoaA/NifB/PqqE/SkfB family radical SAM enzyme
VIGKPAEWAEVDEEGRLLLPAALRAQYGLEPGARLRLDEGSNHLRLHRPVTQLTKIYVEPTVRCNLSCRTCIRHNWQEEDGGTMSDDTFAAILASASRLSPLPTFFFGGLGEPLFHTRTIGWIRQVKALGARAELITNGTMLGERRARQLIASGLDLLWVSIDGATPESYADIRLGAELPQVLANLRLFRKLRRGSHHPRPEIGVAFVAMRRNIDDLPEVLHMARNLGAKHFSVSNVLAYTEEMQAEMLYAHTVRNVAYMSSPWHAQLSLPRLDIDETTRDALFRAFDSDYNVTFAGNSLAGANDVCSFIESGTISIGWDGSVSPCLPLLHTHITYLHGKERVNRRHILGNVNEHDLLDLWYDPEYVAYRQRVQSFAFAPCTFCGGCEMSEANEDDCFGNEFPACGGCLWAQGVIQCP